MLRKILLALLVLVRLSLCEEITVLRDTWGIPHVWAESDEGAFFGLGYVTAQDRGFQMTLSLLEVQGRLSEVVGVLRKVRGRETSLSNDMKMRCFGFWRSARRTAARLDPETSRMLEAYSDGVNAYFFSGTASLHPLFEKVGLAPQRWSPAACVASWWYVGQFFARDGTRELLARRAEGRRRRKAQAARDDEPAVVKRRDVSPQWVRKVVTYAEAHGLRPAGEKGSGEGPHFSHAWVAGRKRVRSGAAVLVSDPQTPVRNPPLWYECHLHGKTFNARGIGVPGSPVLVVGFTPSVAWGATALGADQADLFMLRGVGKDAPAYRFDGRVVPFAQHSGIVRIRGGRKRTITVRESHLGPVVNRFCFAGPGDGPIALKRIPLCEENRDTAQAVLPMLRARNAEAFDRALRFWRFPTVNMVFGDRHGSIGYRACGAFPVRSSQDRSFGSRAMPCAGRKADWQEILPFDLCPHVKDPEDGVLYSANHRPVESWYPIPLGVTTGAGGDTIRSWRLRQRLEAKRLFSEEDILAVHGDALNPARKALVELGLYIRDSVSASLSEDCLSALRRLERWLESGASSELSFPGAALAGEISTFFRISRTSLAGKYGGGESGLVYFLKHASGRMKHKGTFSRDEIAFVDDCLAGAWRSACGKYGENPELWEKEARRRVRLRRLGAFESLSGFPSLDRSLDLSLPALTVLDPGTLGCQIAQSYTQFVPLNDPDRALSICPIGQSELPESPFRLSTYHLWAEKKLHPAPLSRKEVERYAAGSQTIRYGEPPTYSNPVIEKRLADPAVIFHDGSYYLYATGTVDGDNGYRVYTSADLVNWRRGPVVFRPGRPHVWAPDVFRDPSSGKFYLYYTANRTVGVATAARPTGPFTVVKDLFRNAIDAHLFCDDRGKLYLYYVQLPGFRITVQPMASPTEPRGRGRELLRPESEWEVRNGRVTEGPWVLKRGGRYYLLYSGSGANTPDYAVGYCVSESPLGPFVRAAHNPILHRSRHVFGPGHGCAVRDGAGQLYFVYHQKKTPQHRWDRFICMDKLRFDHHGRLWGTATRGERCKAPIPHVETVRNAFLALGFDPQAGLLSLRELPTGRQWRESSTEREPARLLRVQPRLKRVEIQTACRLQGSGRNGVELPCRLAITLAPEEPALQLVLHVSTGARKGRCVFPLRFAQAKHLLVVPASDPEVVPSTTPGGIKVDRDLWKYLPCVGLHAAGRGRCLLFVVESAGIGVAFKEHSAEGGAFLRPELTWPASLKGAVRLRIFVLSEGGVPALKERVRRCFSLQQADLFLKEYAAGVETALKAYDRRGDWLLRSSPPLQSKQ